MSRHTARRRLAGSLVLIAIVLAVSGWFLARNGLNLGLDLQGGMHLVLEVSDPDRTLAPDARSDAVDRAIRVIRTRVDEFGVAEPLIQRSGENRIIVELPGVDEPERAKAVVQRAAFLEFRMVRDTRPLRDAIPRMDRALAETAGGDGTGAVDLDFPAPGAPSFAGMLFETGARGELAARERDVPALRSFLELPEVRRALPRNVALVFGDGPELRGGEAYRPLYVLEDRAFMTGEALEHAAAVRDPELNLPTVSFELNRQGARVFERVTGDHIGERLAILLDGEVVNAPVIQERIGTRGRIEMGRSPMAEAVDLALVLRAGALPAPLEIVEERTVGPSLGADAITRGRWAGAVAVALVVVLIAGYYRVAGLLAVGALAAYALLVLGALAAFRATLTVPGIAGLILSVGMAVDANVLIFERIREELRDSRTPRVAVDAGFRHAMSAIVDANLTTLVTALILFQFGTGPVRGFAVALSIGILASFFTAVFVTRALFLAYVARKRATDPIRI